MNLRKFKQNIRDRRNPFYTLLYRSYFFLQHFRIPLVGPIRHLYGLIYRVSIFSAEMIRVLFRAVYIDPVMRTICSSVGKNLRIERVPYIRGQGNITIGDDVYLSGAFNIQFGNQLEKPPEVRIGDNTFIGHGFSARVAESLVIGKNCYLAGGVRIYDVDGHPKDYLERRLKKPVGPESIRPVRIEDDVWIGADVIILKGVAIGARSIVGAGSVVTKPVLPDKVVSGNPAREIRSMQSNR